MTSAGVLETNDGCRISYAIEGRDDAPPLVLSNSLGTNRDMWSPQLAAWRECFRVVRYDTRGHGRSTATSGPYSIARLARDVVELLDFLELRAVHFCGLSLGGMTGLWLAAHVPQRIDELVIANSSAHLGPASAWHERSARVRAAGMAAIADAVVERWFTPEFRLNSPHQVDEIRSMLLHTSTDGYTGCCAAIAGMNLSSVLQQIRARSLVISGTRDPATPLAHAQTITAGIPGSRMVEIAAAHLSNIEQPEAFSALVMQHLSAHKL